MGNGRTLIFSLDIKDYDYQSVIAAVRRLADVNGGAKEMILNLINKISDNTKDKVLIALLQNKFICKKICSSLEDALNKNGIGMKVARLDVGKSAQERLQISLQFTEYEWGQILEALTEKLKKSDNKYAGELGAPALNAYNTVLPEEMKETLFISVLNACSDGLCGLLEEQLRENLGILIQFSKIECKNK